MLSMSHQDAIYTSTEVILYVVAFPDHFPDQESFDHLSATGHLICYGFHSNVPKGAQWLSPAAWVSMALGMLKMPRFDPMELVTTSRSVSGFNLSFFADEQELIARSVSVQYSGVNFPLSRIIMIPSHLFLSIFFFYWQIF